MGHRANGSGDDVESLIALEIILHPEWQEGQHIVIGRGEEIVGVEITNTSKDRGHLGVEVRLTDELSESVAK